MERKRF